jgi:uncharacterized membrane protein
MPDQINNTRKELWEVTFIWLKALGNNLPQRYVQAEITTHPDYPSLLSVTDFLDSGNMSYYAVAGDKNDIASLQYPLLVNLQHSGVNYMHYVENELFWQNNNGLSNYWTGVALFPANQKKWENKKIEVFKKTQTQNRNFVGLLAIVALSGFTLASLNSTGWMYKITGLLALGGLVISVLALGVELGMQNNTIKQVCGTLSKGGCEKVLKTHYATGWAGFTIADISTIYFLTQLVIYVIGCYNTTFNKALYPLAFGGIPVVALSIYIQGVKIKHWCFLCLCIAGVLLLQFAIAINNNWNEALNYSISLFIGALFLSSLFFWPIKKLLISNKSSQLKLIELKRWKLDLELFMYQWKNQEEVDETIWKNDLLLGNAKAPLLIIIVCSPYCQPCAHAHQHLHSILKKYDGKLKVLIRWSCPPGDGNDTISRTVKTLLQVSSEQNDNQLVAECLNDWFNKMDISSWEAKWTNHTLTTEKINVQKRWQQHREWVAMNRIIYTPTIFINGLKIPSRYSMADLELLLPQLLQSTENIKKKNYHDLNKD